MIRRRISGSDGPGRVRFLAGLGLVRVVGRSMQPTLYEGDLLLVRPPREPQPGALVVVQLPGGRPLAVKRVWGRQPEGWWVERDNLREGVDSWEVGAVPDSDLQAEVLLRLWPWRRKVAGG